MLTELFLTAIGALSLAGAGMARARGRNPAVWWFSSLVGFFFTIPYLLTKPASQPELGSEVKAYYGISALIAAITAFIVLHGVYVSQIF